MDIKISQNLLALCLLLASARASINSRKPGWLDRVVQFRKDNFLKDVQKLPAVEIHARIEKAPPGFEDSKNWDFESVMRLLGLLRQSETGRDVHRALRRSMMAQPNRRIYMSLMDTYKYFPNIHKDNYYQDTDMESLELIFDTTPHSSLLEDNDVIIVSNPVEARLPSTKISVKMLRTILEERAFAARIMPPTTKMPIDWKPMNKTKKADNTTTSSNDTESNSTSPDIATSSSVDTESVTTESVTTESVTTESVTTESVTTESVTTVSVTSATETVTNNNSPSVRRRHIKKPKPAALRNKKPKKRASLEPRENAPTLRKRKSKKRPSRKAAPRLPYVLPHGR